MDMMMLGLMQMTQTMTERQPAAAADSGKEQETTFRDLLNKQQAAERKPDGKDGAPMEAQPEGTAGSGEPAETEELVPQDQLLAAAMAALQNPVVPAEEPVTVTQEAPVVAAVRQAVQPQEAAPVKQEAVEQPMAETQQSVDAPEARQTDAPVQRSEVPQAPQEQREQSLNTERSGEQKRDLDVTERSGEDGGETVVFQNVKEVPVKVGEAEAAPETDLTASVKDQVGEKLAKALEQGESRLTIQLTPENLGAIEVRMTVTEDGRLLVALHAETRQTQQLLEKGLDGLQALLSRSVQQEVQVEVPRQEESQRQDFEDGRQNQQQENPRQHKEQKHSGNDFLHQLRLGLVPLEGELA